MTDPHKDPAASTVPPPPADEGPKLSPFNLPISAEVRVPAAYLKLYETFQAHTMVRREKFIENLALVAHFAKLEGDVVECGTWRGGMACGMIHVAGPEKRYHFFDSFAGLPAPREDLDGDRANSLFAGNALVMGNNFADYDAFMALIAEQPVAPANVTVHRGWFKDTLPDFPQDRRIAVLRLDGDWYDSTYQCLEALYPKVVRGGVIIIDDYDNWDGCSRAVHDYLSMNKLLDKIYRTPVCSIAYMVKWS